MANQKRSATRELNHDNWNEEEEDEEAGEFKRAPEDVLKQRQIKVAKRRMPDTADGAPKVNPFSGFGGFGKTSSSAFSTSTPALGATASSTPFAFLGNLAAPALAGSATTPSPVPKINGTSSSDDKVTFHSKLKELNIAFVAWIQKNVAENSIVDLAPVFKSYEENLKSLNDAKVTTTANVETKKPANDSENPTTATSFSFGAPAPANKPSAPAFASSGFSFGAATDTAAKPKDDTAKPAASGFGSFSGFGSSSTTTTAPAAAPTFSFGLSAAAADTTKTSDFSFGFAKPDAAAAVSSKPSSTPTFSFGLQATSTSVFGGLNSAAPSFSFGNVTQVSKPDATGGAEEETEEPPKNEFVPVVEDDSLYSKRCKVFVKSGADFADRGVGTLYIKKVDDKIQMIVRADTNLGNILLNIMLASGLPASRMGKNNVMLVCIPTPDAKPPPTSVLLRVKNGDEADEVLAMINKHKMSE